MTKLISEEELLQSKAAFGPLSALRVEGIDVYYRSLTPFEISSLMELEKAFPKKQWAEALVSVAVIHPKGVKNKFQQAGSIYVLKDAIMEVSIPVDDKGNFQIESYREWAKEAVNKNAAVALACLIAGAYPSLNLLELLTTPIEQLMRLAAIVEEVTKQDLFKKGKSNQTDPAIALREATQHRDR